MSAKSDLKVGKPVCIAASGDKCGEGILWNAATRSIYWTDINRFLIDRSNLERAAVETGFLSEPVTCVLATNRGDTLALAGGAGIALWEPKRALGPKRLFSLRGWPCDRRTHQVQEARGALWVGSMRNNA